MRHTHSRTRQCQHDLYLFKINLMISSIIPRPKKELTQFKWVYQICNRPQVKRKRKREKSADLSKFVRHFQKSGQSNALV